MPLKHAARPAAAVALSVASIVSMVSTSSIVGCAASSGTKPAAPAADAAAPTPANAPNAITMPAPLKLNLRQDNVVDDYHGTKVRDPFRWLEQPDSPDTAAFISATNAHFRGFVDEGPTRDKIKARLMELYNYPRLGAPSVRGKFFVFGTNTGLQNQSIVRVAESVADTTNTDARVLFDPNTLSADGTVALGGTAFTDDGKLVAYELASGGSDETTVHVRDVATGKDLPDTLPLTRQGVTGWLPDNSGFYYNKFPARGTVPPGQEAVNGKLYYHQLGTPTSADKLVHAPADPELSPGGGLTDDGKYLLVYVTRGTSPKNRVYYREFDKADPANGDLKPLFVDEDAAYSVIANDGPVFYVQTDRDAPRGRIVAVDVSKPGPADPKNWREVIPQSELPIDGVSVVADRLIVQYKQDASDIVKLYQLDGTFVRDIPLPTVGVVGFSAAQRKDKQVFFTFTSFTYPPTIYRLNFEADPKGEVTLHRQAQVKFNPDDYESTRVFATSKDGTRVPLFVVHKKGLKLDGTAPAILYGYGGFNISMGPGFNPLTIAWLEQGGVYAMACLRGGNEYGEDWHQAGMLGRKQNVFDDLYACSKKLVAAGYTSHRKLAIEGGSNGGLLTAAAVVQKPDLFGAVVSHVPVIDMYRYHKMGIGRFWVPEYGSAEKSEDFQWLSAYSPLHNVKPNVDYPPILVTTAEGDDRVVPAHAFKFAATMITTSTSRNPLFLRTETKAGHGGGKPVSKVMDEVADKYAFLAKVFGMGWK